ncbi:phage tail tape measure protein, partial [Yersinia enterocolitica]
MQKDLRKFKGEFKDVMQSVAMMGAAIGGAFIIPINQAMEFESSMADVRKVVDFDTPAQFKEMGEDILKLSTELPMAANGIAAIVAAGGQAGIARSDLKAFATDAIKMGIAFDQTAEESGQMMAQWRTAFKLTQNEVVTLADKV